MVFNCKTVGFILDPGNELKALAGSVDRKFHVVKIQPSGAVIVVLYHSADRNIQSQFLQDRGGNIDLPPAAVHHDEVGKAGKTPQLCIQVLFLHFLLLLQSVAEAAGKDLPHAGIVVGPRNRFDAELPVIAPLGFPVFIDYHGSDIGKTADV